MHRVSPQKRIKKEGRNNKQSRFTFAPARTGYYSPIGKITEKTQIEFEVPTYFQVMARILQEKCLDLTGRKLGCFPENAGSLDCHLVVSFLPFLKFRTKLRQTDIAHKYLDEWKWSPIPFKAN